MSLDNFSTISGIGPGPIEPKVLETSRKPEIKDVKPAFQKFLDLAVSALEDVSKTEVKTNELINQYIEGKATLQEVMSATAKLNIELQLAVTVTNSLVTAFKELTQMPI